MFPLWIALGIFVFGALPFVTRGRRRDQEVDMPVEAIYVDTQRHEPRVRSSATQGRRARYRR